MYKYMNSISRNVHSNKLHDMLNKYNYTYHSITRMKLADVKSSTYIDFNKENNKENPKFEVGDRVRLSKYKNISAKVYAQYQ